MWAPLLIRILADFSEVQIVLSTSWVRELSFNRARRWLQGEVRACVVRSTWHSAKSFKRERFRSLATWWDEATRNQQIRRYAGLAGLSDGVAIDNQLQGWGADDVDELVRTHSETGLSDPVVLALLAARLEVLRKSDAC